ncbi:hypothetical protein ACFY7C_04745 [Streptomyces sp. NPDC012769]
MTTAFPTATVRGAAVPSARTARPAPAARTARPALTARREAVR